MVSRFRHVVKARVEDTLHPDFEKTLATLAQRQAKAEGYTGPIQILVDEATGVIIMSDYGDEPEKAAE